MCDLRSQFLYEKKIGVNFLRRHCICSFFEWNFYYCYSLESISKNKPTHLNTAYYIYTFLPRSLDSYSSLHINLYIIIFFIYMCINFSFHNRRKCNQATKATSMGSDFLLLETEHFHHNTTSKIVQSKWNNDWH